MNKSKRTVHRGLKADGSFLNALGMARAITVESVNDELASCGYCYLRELNTQQSMSTTSDFF